MSNYQKNLDYLITSKSLTPRSRSADINLTKTIRESNKQITKPVKAKVEL